MQAFREPPRPMCQVPFDLRASHASRLPFAPGFTRCPASTSSRRLKGQSLKHSWGHAIIPESPSWPLMADCFLSKGANPHSKLKSSPVLLAQASNLRMCPVSFLLLPEGSQSKGVSVELAVSSNCCPNFRACGARELALGRGVRPRPKPKPTRP